MRNSVRAMQRLNSVTGVEDEMKPLDTPTISRSYRYIEGYLLKEINKTSLLRKTARHLRYFRIVFATGKMNIKTCKDQGQMRSF